MILRHLRLSNIRNIPEMLLDPHHQLNLFTGDNGAGKTSILEGIYLLGRAQSFRSKRARSLIRREQATLSSFGFFETKEAQGSCKIGVVKGQDASTDIKVNNDKLSSLAELSRYFPVTVIHPLSYQLLEAGPKVRRKFLDWGVFHVKHQSSQVLSTQYTPGANDQAKNIRKKDSDLMFHVEPHVVNSAINNPCQEQSSNSENVIEADHSMFHVKQDFMAVWKNNQWSLRQRNHLLRQARNNSALNNVIDSSYCETAEQVHAFRKAYFERFCPIFYEILGLLIDLDDIRLSYYAGWNQEKPLSELLRDSYERDKQIGYTQFGPHRADMRVKVGTLSVHEVLSRGQQKMLVYALMLARGALQAKQTGEPGVYLLDDLCAELDAKRQLGVIDYLMAQNAQVFLTGLCEKDFDYCLQHREYKVHTVNNGKLVPS